MVNFLTKNEFVFADFDGCMYGLVASSGEDIGMPINKPWRVACSPNSSLPKFLNKKCDKSHKHCLCQGVHTLRTQQYTEEIVKRVHQSLNYDVKHDTRRGGNIDDGAFMSIAISASEVDLPCVFAGRVDSNGNGDGVSVMV